MNKMRGTGTFKIDKGCPFYSSNLLASQVATVPLQPDREFAWVFTVSQLIS